MAEDHSSRGTGGAVVRIGIQSADRLRREALAGYLESLPTFTVVGRLAHHEDAASMCALERPDIMLLNAEDDATPAVTACRSMQSRCPDVRVVLTYERLSAHDVAAARAAGVAAVVPNSHGLGAVLSTLRQVSGGMSLSLPGGTGLSDRQREILLLMASGHSAIEIGRMLRISPGTVENHKRRLYAKLNATSAVHAIARAATFGIIEDRLTSWGSKGATDPSPWTGDSATHASETGRTPLIVAAGDDRDILDRVVETVIVHRFPVFREHGPGAARYGHWWRWHRGPVVRVLVNPTQDHWQVGTAFGRSAVVVHSGHLDQRVMMAALSNGAAAVVPAEHVEEQLGPVLSLVAKGYVVMKSAFSDAAVHNAYGPFAERRAEPPALTSREHDILRSIGASYTVRQTAIRLGIAVKTVENTQGNLFRKLGVHNRAEALASAYSLGLLQPSTARDRDRGVLARTIRPA